MQINLAIFMAFGIFSPVVSQASVNEIEAKVNKIFEPWSKSDILGAAVAIVQDGRPLLVKGYGCANLETNEQVTENTHFCIGSCTKSFTGLSFLRLLDEGRIDLNTPVREIAPEIEINNPWKDTDPVRIVHLLEHTAGFEDLHPNWFYFESPVVPLQRALKIKAHLLRQYLSQQLR